MSDEEQAKVWLELYKSARARFQEIESIGWKFNYSIWGFLAGIAYLVKSVHLPSVSLWVLIAIGSVPILIHLLVLVESVRSKQEMARPLHQVRAAR